MKFIKLTNANYGSTIFYVNIANITCFCVGSNSPSTEVYLLEADDKISVKETPEQILEMIRN